MVNTLQPQTLDLISDDLVQFKDLIHDRTGALAKATIFPTGQILVIPIGRRMQSVEVLKSLLKIKESEAKKILTKLRNQRDSNALPVFVTRISDNSHEFAVVRVNAAA